MSINQRVKEVRHELGLSQAKFAKAISISNGYIAGIELGNRNVNDRLIKLICATFSVNEEWLKAGVGSMFGEKPNQLAELAYSTFKELKPEYQEYVLNQIDQLIEIQHKEATPLASTLPDYEAEARAEAEEYYREILAEKKAEAESLASQNDGSTGPMGA